MTAQTAMKKATQNALNKMVPIQPMGDMSLQSELDRRLCHLGREPGGQGQVVGPGRPDVVPTMTATREVHANESTVRADVQ
jgi:hypothetical protein